MSKFWNKTVELGAWTVAESFVGSLLVAYGALGEKAFTDRGALLVAAGTALATALSFVKSIAVRKIGAQDQPTIAP